MWRNDAGNGGDCDLLDPLVDDLEALLLGREIQPVQDGGVAMGEADDGLDAPDEPLLRGPSREHVVDSPGLPDGGLDVARRGRKKLDGFEDVRFAGAVRADQDVQPPHLDGLSCGPEREDVLDQEALDRAFDPREGGDRPIAACVRHDGAVRLVVPFEKALRGEAAIDGQLYYDGSRRGTSSIDANELLD